MLIINPKANQRREKTKQQTVNILVCKSVEMIMKKCVKCISHTNKNEFDGTEKKNLSNSTLALVIRN
jgi:hypothetical protein